MTSMAAAGEPMHLRLAVRFLLELCLLGGAGVAGAALGWWAVVVGPASVAAVWGRWVAPRARRRCADPVRLAIEMVVFFAVGVSLAAAGHPGWGAGLALSSSLVAIWVRRPARTVTRG